MPPGERAFPSPWGVQFCWRCPCGPSEEEILIAELQEDLTRANTTIDSLNYTVESSNLLIDNMRSRVDSLQRVDAKLLQSVQRLNKAVKRWRNLARDHKRKNEQLNRGDSQPQTGETGG